MLLIRVQAFGPSVMRNPKDEVMMQFYYGTVRNLRNLRNYTVKLAVDGCTKPKVDTKQHVSI